MQLKLTLRAAIKSEPANFIERLYQQQEDSHFYLKANSPLMVHFLFDIIKNPLYIIKNMKTYILLFIFLFLISSCQTVTISPDGKKTILSSNPTYEESQNFFLGGLGESNINVEEICRERPVKQMQTQQTFVNGLVSLVTLGIYTPRTAKIWCEK